MKPGSQVSMFSATAMISVSASWALDLAFRALVPRRGQGALFDGGEPHAADTECGQSFEQLAAIDRSGPRSRPGVV